MINELLFLLHTIFVVCTSIVFTRLGVSWLVALLSFYVLLSNLFISQQITLFGFDVTSTDVFAVGTTITINLMQEFFGITQARRAIVTSLALSLFFLLMSIIHLAYHPNLYDTMRPHFSALLAWTPRVISTSIVSYFIIQWVDTSLYQFLYQKCKGAFFTGRAITSLVIVQFLDTLFFSFVGLYGLVASVSNIIIVSLAVKCIAILISFPLLFWAKQIIHQDKKI